MEVCFSAVFNPSNQQQQQKNCACEKKMKSYLKTLLLQKVYFQK